MSEKASRAWVCEGVILESPISEAWKCSKLKPNGKCALKKGFTDADSLGVMCPAEWKVELKTVFLGAVFLIDFVHFENKGDN